MNTLKILAIDDNKDNLTTLKGVVQDGLPACALLTALNGPRGLELALTEDPDVILLDIVMPGMDGYEVCRRLKADERSRPIPIVFLTALRTDRESRIQALDCGADGFLTKPVDGQELVAAVRAMAKVKVAMLMQRNETTRLAGLVAERTQSLQQSHWSLLNMLEDMRAENEARKQAAALAQREQILSNTIIESIPGAFYLLDEHGRYARWNNYQREVIIGKPEEQIAGMNALDTIHPEDRPLIQARIANVLQDGKDETVEGRVLLHGGPAFIWMLMTGRRMTIAGHPFLVGSGIDITERKLAEESLRESEEKYRLLAENATDVIWVLDVESETFRYMSPSVKRLRGYTAEEVMQQGLAAALTPASLEYLRSVVPGRLARFRQGQIEFFHDEIEQIHKDGRAIWTEVNARYFVNRATGRVEVTGATRDITERKRAEAYRAMGVEVLQILNEPGDLSDIIQRVIAMMKTRTGFDAVGLRLQNGEDFPYYAQDGFSTEFLLTENMLIERGKDGDVCRDKDGHACLGCTCGLVIAGKADPANPRFTRGGSCWMNDSSRLLDLPADQDPRLHPRNQCIHDGYASVALVPIRTKDQIVGLIQLNDRRKGCFTLESVELLEGIASHVGEALMRKQAEMEQIKLQSQLVQAQKMESVGRLAGGVAHDFNNMLAVILGYTEIAMEQVNMAQPLFAALREIRKAAERSAKLTRQLLAFARKQTIAPRVLDLNETVDGMLNMLRRLIGEDIDLVWKPGRNLWPVKVDPSQIDQLLANLCANARDAIAGVGKVTVETDTAAFDEAWCATHTGVVPGEYVLLAFSDNGCGMDQETLGHLFEPFFTTKGVGKGTGLGLATVYGMVQQNNGFINVDSEPSQGTTFKVYLPRHAAQTASLSETAPGRSAERGDETILLVEDEPAILKMATMMLERLGYAVVGARTPGEAVRLAEAHAGGIHLLVTDVVMPDMNGRDLAEHLLSMYPNLKCLFMSGYTADIIAHQGVLAARVQFIQKPFSLTDLAAKVRQALGDEQRKE